MELQHQIIALGEDFWEASATYPSVLARWQATGGGFYQRPLQVVEVHRLVWGADSWTTWIRGHSHEKWCFFHVSFSDDLEEQTQQKYDFWSSFSVLTAPYLGGKPGKPQLVGAM